MTVRTLQLDDSVNPPAITAAVVAAGSSAPPTLIAGGDSFEVAEDTQVFTFARCRVDGTLVITGTLH